ncbi:universal stress protein UspB [Vibrio rumoiensis]|uniref:Universal stress protein B n=1 Tax=Vibrio rumoiensis 1S-45 TaxID=1188252 RepID=A0A1E5E6A4_9VIBR|nr:universal stress protein UspB [Vibrio rumoiensis]OEF30021.1 universal stress protein UspB [Vibrio rumoiensis 1S-45]
MISADTLLTALTFVTVINLVRYFTALRSLIFIMREAHPLLYQQVDGRGFFRTHGNVAKQVRLYHYLKDKEYLHHHEDVFINKCSKVRELFVLSSGLTFVTLLLAIMI